MPNHQNLRLICCNRSKSANASSLSHDRRYTTSREVCTRLVTKVRELSRRSPSLAEYAESIVDNLLAETPPEDN